jgi:uncharacterized protein (TIGR02996 family)
MRHFEYRDGKSDKFWDIDLQGKSFTVRFGRAGTAGQTQTKGFADEGKAKAAHDKLIQEKLAKGYVEKALPAAPSPTQRALEQALAEDPDDRAAHAAYADYLQEQGDPRGEFIQVQLALEDPALATPQRKQLQKREQALLKRHRRDWLGELAPHLLDVGDLEEWQRAPQHQFAHGWLDSLQIPDLTLSFARALARAPQARLLRRLVVEGTSDDEEDEEDDIPEGVDERVVALCPLLRSPNLRNVRVFQLGEQMDPDDFGSTHAAGFDVVVPLVRNMPRLEELYLLAHLAGYDLEALFRLKTLHQLRVLQVYHVEHRYPLEVLARNASLGRLTHLWLRPHGFGLNVPDSGAYIDLAGVRALVRSRHLKGLTHLRVQLCNMGDRGCEEIVRSGVLERLKVLELTYGEVTDEGARVLAACPALRNLERLDLSHNSLTEAGRKALAAVPIQVWTDEQFRGDPSESGYLGYGDME